MQCYKQISMKTPSKLPRVIYICRGIKWECIQMKFNGFEFRQTQELFGIRKLNFLNIRGEKDIQKDELLTSL